MNSRSCALDDQIGAQSGIFIATTPTEMFGIPAENLTTQGYGEQDLKINT
jgi:hypothetical protein